MPTAKEIKERLKTLSSLEQVTDAMRKTAAARISRAKNNMMSFRPYVDALDGLLSDIFSNCSANNNRLNQKPENVNRSLLIFITADKGLCGSFNADIFNAVKHYLLDVGHETDVIIVGRKGVLYNSRKGLKEILTFTDLPFDFPYSISEEIGNVALDLFLNQNYSQVDLIYTKFLNIVMQKPATKRLLPYIPGDITDTGSPFTFEPKIEEMLDSVISLHIKSSIYSAMLESRASEQAARMVMMEKANKNSSDMIDDLVLVSNKLRQARITRELSEIIGASEFLS